MLKAKRNSASIEFFLEGTTAVRRNSLMKEAWRDRDGLTERQADKQTDRETETGRGRVRGRERDRDRSKK